MTLIFQRICPSIHITLCHAEYKLATSNVTSHLAIPWTNYFSDVALTSSARASLVNDDHGLVSITMNANSTWMVIREKAAVMIAEGCEKETRDAHRRLREHAKVKYYY